MCLAQLSPQLCFEDVPATCQGPLQACTSPHRPEGTREWHRVSRAVAVPALVHAASVSPSRGRMLAIVCVQVTLPGSAERQLLDREKDLP